MASLTITTANQQTFSLNASIVDGAPRVSVTPPVPNCADVISSFAMNSVLTQAYQEAQIAKPANFSDIVSDKLAEVTTTCGSLLDPNMTYTNVTLTPTADGTEIKAEGLAQGSNGSETVTLGTGTFANDGEATFTQVDVGNVYSWNTHVIAIDAAGRITADNYDFESAANWISAHTLSAPELTGLNETSANALVATIEREAVVGGITDDGTPSAMSLDPSSFGEAHQFSEGSYEIQVGQLDDDPNTPETVVELIDPDNNANAGLDLSGIDNAYQDWSYGAASDDTPAFETYNFDEWAYGDFFEPVVLDLNGNGIEITPRTGSNAYFDVDADGYFERTAWAGPNDGMLVIDLAHNVTVDANGNLTAASYIGDGIIEYVEEISFWASNPSVDTDLKAIADLFDSNHNHQLDAGDAHWSSFKVWRDTNQDGKTDAGEPVTLASGRRCHIELRQPSRVAVH